MAPQWGHLTAESWMLLRRPLQKPMSLAFPLYRSAKGARASALKLKGVGRIYTDDPDRSNEFLNPHYADGCRSLYAHMPAFMRSKLQCDLKESAVNMPARRMETLVKLVLLFAAIILIGNINVTAQTNTPAGGSKDFAEAADRYFD